MIPEKKREEARQLIEYCKQTASQSFKSTITNTLDSGEKNAKAIVGSTLAMTEEFLSYDSAGNITGLNLKKVAESRTITPFQKSRIIISALEINQLHEMQLTRLLTDLPGPTDKIMASLRKLKKQAPQSKEYNRLIGLIGTQYFDIIK